MNQIKITGQEHVGNIKFTGIEGGFGKDKKAMLVKDIAKIHDQSIGNINRIINNNRKWFEDGIDVIDLLNASDAFKEFAKENGMVKSNRTKHVYLLSERGYSMLIKFMDDEKATQIYKQITNGYFDQRSALKNKQPELVNDGKAERLAIMKSNSETRRASLMYRIAMATKSETGKENLLARAAKELTGEMTLPAQKNKEYSAEKVAEKIEHGLTGNMVGRLANKLEIKAEQPGQNEYGRWANGKSRYSDHETPQWLYFEKGVQTIKNEWQKSDKYQED